MCQMSLNKSNEKQRDVKIAIFSFYFNEEFISEKIKFLKSKNISIWSNKDKKNLLREDLLDMTIYSEIIEENQNEGIIIINDTLFKKFLWKRTLNNIVIAAANFKDYHQAPLIIGDLHKTAGLISALHPSKKHISTYCFYVNLSAQSLFQKIYKKIEKIELENLLLVDEYKFLYLQNFGTDEYYNWKKANKVNEQIITKKFKSILIEFELSRAIYDRGILLDCKRSVFDRLVNKVRHLLR